MAKKDAIDQFIEERIQVEFLENVMGERFGSYAKYIIQDRAIPDVRDGLKPVQRRILYAMKAVGMVYGEPYKKSARIVGEVIGKYHPHGDSSVYEALVRMSQDFKINLPLIDMHGNNGSIDGDGAAAMRYTEARLSEGAMFLLSDIDKKTVQFVPNYDDSEIEPVVLPAKFPNLLVNGSEGISAGYATNIPPHNLNETINLTIARIKNPNLTIDEALEILPGPDFPTGGIIENSDELKQAFETGRGKVVVRSKYNIEGHDIIVSEIPYGVVKSALVKRIDAVMNSKKIDGIVEVRDESDKDGLRIVIETRQESNPEIILNYLLKSTDLQVNINYNMVAIVDKSPMTLGVLPIIDAYIMHAKEVIRNRSFFELDKAKRRLHIVEGLTKLVGISDEVIKTIRESNGKQDSKKNIIEKYDFTEIQAEAIVTLQLYRLSKFEVQELLDEKVFLENEIRKLENILSNESALKKVIIGELEDINKKIITPRKSVISLEEKKLEFKEEDLLIHEDVRVLITKDGYIKRMSLKAYQLALDNNQVFGLKENDYIIFDSKCNTIDTILLFTNLGSYVNLPVFKIPEMKYKDLGTYIGTLFDIEGLEKVIEIYHINEPVKKGNKLLLSTKSGKVKLSEIDELFEKRYRKGTVMKFNDNDELVSASIEFEDYDEVLAVTKLGYIIKYPKNEVPVSGLKALGVKSISLRPKDEVIMSKLVPNYFKEELLLLTNRGTLKRVLLKSIERTRRNGKSTMFLKSVKSNPYEFVSAIITNPSKYKDSIELLILSHSGMMKYKGTEIPKDNFEHGAPILNKDVPIALYLRELDKAQIKKEDIDLSKDLKKSIEEIRNAHPNSLIDELGDIINKQASIFDFIDDKNEEKNDDEDDDLDKIKFDLF